jgi:GH18 family chitinase
MNDSYNTELRKEILRYITDKSSVELVADFSALSNPRTLNNWLNGTKPSNQWWPNFIIMADVGELNEADTDIFLATAKFLKLRHYRELLERESKEEKFNRVDRQSLEEAIESIQARNHETRLDDIIRRVESRSILDREVVIEDTQGYPADSPQKTNEGSIRSPSFKQWIFVTGITLLIAIGSISWFSGLLNSPNDPKTEPSANHPTQMTPNIGTLAVTSVPPDATTPYLEPATTSPAAEIFTLHQDIAPPTSKRIIGYYEATNVGEHSEYSVTDIPAEKLSHVIYTSLNVNTEGKCEVNHEWADLEHPYPVADGSSEPVLGNFNQLNLLKERYTHLKTIISVGGWDWSEYFSMATESDESRQRFAESCVQLMKQYGFDGIEVDWKYPVSGGKKPGRPENKENYPLLLSELRRQLNVQSTSEDNMYFLTVAAPATPGGIANHELLQMSEYLDWFTIAAYDLRGTRTRTGFNAPLFALPGDPADTDGRFNVDVAVQTFLAAGVSPSKLVLGVPFYGRGWTGVSNDNNGLYQVATGTVNGTWDRDERINYRDLKNQFLPTYLRQWSDEAKVPWLFNPSTGIMISYDDPDSLTYKANYVIENQLSGVAVWELSRDDDQHSLLTTLYEHLSE